MSPDVRRGKIVSRTQESFQGKSIAVNPDGYPE